MALKFLLKGLPAVWSLIFVWKSGNTVISFVGNVADTFKVFRSCKTWMRGEKKNCCSGWGSNSQPPHASDHLKGDGGTVYKYGALTDCATGAAGQECDILLIYIQLWYRQFYPVYKNLFPLFCIFVTLISTNVTSYTLNIYEIPQQA